jgi:hypothetical protein
MTLLNLRGGRLLFFLMPRKKIHDALERLAAQEQAFIGTQFLAPLVAGGNVAVRIGGVVCNMKATPRNFEGFGIFKADSHSRATLVREATMNERRRYLDLFPRVLLVVFRRQRDLISAVPANQADGRFSIEGQIELRLMGQEADLYDTIVARFDGNQFWFDRLDARGNPAAAPYLRQAFLNNVAPQDLDRSSLSPGHRLAFAINHQVRIDAAAAAERARVLDQRTRAQEQLGEALGHAGARLRDFVEQGEQYRVTYEIDGQRHVSVVRRGDLTVQTAGICLSGLDANFDLASLVGVMREAREQS